LGEDLTSVARSPHLDYFRQHDLEVLYLVEPIDSFMIMTLKEFAGKKLQNVDDAALELPKDDKPIESKVENEDFAQLAARIKTTLGEAITEVRESQLLTDSPCRMVSPSSEPIGICSACAACWARIMKCPRRSWRSIAATHRGYGLARARTCLLDACIHQLFESSLLLLPWPAAMVPHS
jgi:hypothetical protein